MNGRGADDSPRVRLGEPPLRVFVSGVIDAETEVFRERVVARLDPFPFLAPWAFEFAPASSEPLNWSYLQKVRDCDLLIWVAGSRTSAPVQREIHEAMTYGKPILVCRLEGAIPDEPTDLLVNETGVKWQRVTLSEIGDAVVMSVADDMVRAYRKGPSQERLTNLDDTARFSLARRIERWRAAGLTRQEALDFAGRSDVGLPTTEMAPSPERPIRILVGDVGVGKSLVGDRLLQEALQRALSDPDAPVPIWIQARDIGSSKLRAVVENSAGGAANLRRVGAFVVIDDLSQVGGGRADEILSEARVLAGASPSTRFVITSRPTPTVSGQREGVTLAPLPLAASLELVRALVGRQVTGYGWPESVRDAVRRPLFAILASVYLRESAFGTPRSTGDLIRHLVQRNAALDNPGIQASLRRIGRLSTDREGGGVPVQEVGNRVELQRANDIGLLVETAQTIAFGLPILTEWFAAQSLLEGDVDIDELSRDAPRLDLWRYAFVIAVAEASFEQSCALLAPVVRSDPGFASQVIVDAMPQWETTGTDAQLPGYREVGEWIRRTTNAWFSILIDIARYSRLTDANGVLRPMAIAVNGGRVTQAFGSAADAGQSISELPDTYSAFGPTPGYEYVRSASPPIEPAWPWRWSHETTADALKGAVEGQLFVPPEGAIFDELIWSASLMLVGAGSLRSEPLDLNQLDGVLHTLPEDGVLRIDRRLVTVETLRHRFAQMRAAGKSELQAPWPGWDRPPSSGWVWGPFSPERLLERTIGVFEGAVRAYIQVVETWLAPIANRLTIYATLPAQLTGTLTVRDGEDYASGPVLTWWFDPIRADAATSVRFSLGELPADAVFGAKPGGEQYTKLIAMRPRARRWLHASRHQQALDIFGSTPATQLAFRWLADDLKRIRLWA